MAYSPALQTHVLAQLDDSIRGLKASGDPAASEEFSRAMLAKYFLGRIEERDLPPLARAFLNAHSHGVLA